MVAAGSLLHPVGTANRSPLDIRCLGCFIHTCCNRISARIKDNIQQSSTKPFSIKTNHNGNRFPLLLTQAVPQKAVPASKRRISSAMILSECSASVHCGWTKPVHRRIYQQPLTSGQCHHHYDLVTTLKSILAQPSIRLYWTTLSRSHTHPGNTKPHTKSFFISKRPMSQRTEPYRPCEARKAS